MVYSEPLEQKIDLLSERLDKRYPDIQNTRWAAIKLLEQDTEVMKKYPLDCVDILDRSYETEIINEKYAFIEEIIHEVLFHHEEKEEMTDRIDRILTHRWIGLPIFLCIMALVFFLTFFLGDRLSDGFQALLTALPNGTTHLLQFLHVSDVGIALVVDGVIAGVGGILTFLPNIFVLFLALALLEDSYMARVAYVMDGIMGKLGLSGAFLPMVLGFGCSVPAIMASRVLENPRDRYKTMLVMLVLHIGNKNHEPNDLLILRGVHPHVAHPELRPRRLHHRDEPKLRRPAGQVARALLRPHRPGLLADRRGLDRRHLCQRGGGLQYRRPVRHQ